MAGEKCIHTFIPKYFCTSGLVAQKLKGWNEPFVHSVGVLFFVKAALLPNGSYFVGIVRSHQNYNAGMNPSLF